MDLDEPAPRDVPVTAILAALADENRLAVVRELADGSERACGTFVPEWSKATRSHHLRVLREAGITRTRVAGTNRLVSLRRADLDAAYPGLLDAVLTGAARVSS
ncbi:ArsR/SmtB family transcription factor [Spirilliplanes yamanashiensis]|uniref:Transcriptional regulator n=1 Tax=Spirilliplanes yamanashiensis TaxID=42233 RepID=A0A8J4DHU2_9ACTN|nr:helix-turn-helix domain-containing protein [Spirilliplanes yamanashiensis]MDP9814489.1 DNA-binding transcriptional ArsR family regulator [Spirilliplanes yamanashiensis]GIJ02141.1 transcriptional regulator [Spirilliplanes yamanashiensis]